MALERVCGVLARAGGKRRLPIRRFSSKARWARARSLSHRLLHSRSRRAQRGPMLRHQAIPAELIDSELFGHERGSFTGASQTRLGWFERADGGTLSMRWRSCRAAQSVCPRAAAGGSERRRARSLRVGCNRVVTPPIATCAPCANRVTFDTTSLSHQRFCVADPAARAGPRTSHAGRPLPTRPAFDWTGIPLSVRSIAVAPVRRYSWPHRA